MSYLLIQFMFLPPLIIHKITVKWSKAFRYNDRYKWGIAFNKATYERKLNSHMAPSWKIYIPNNKIHNAKKPTLISSSCISRYSNFLFLSETESSDGKVVTPTVSTTSSGREESVAWTASSGLTFPETENALQREWDDHTFPENP